MAAHLADRKVNEFGTFVEKKRIPNGGVRNYWAMRTLLATVGKSAPPSGPVISDVACSGHLKSTHFLMIGWA